MKKNTELTDEQVEQLFAFCRKNGVIYYDLQTELADHLADAITAKMNEEDRHVDFDTALDEVYASFGVMGFAPIVAAKRKSLARWVAKEKCKMFMSYFTWPKAALTAMLAAVLSIAPFVLSFFWLKVLLITSSAVFLVWESVKTIQLKKKRKLQTEQLLLTRKTYEGPGVAVYLFIQLSTFQGMNWFGNQAKFVKEFYIFSIVLILLLLIALAKLSFITKLHAFARKQYPGAFEQAWKNS
jgi:hypothetical protein